MTGTTGMRRAIALRCELDTGAYVGAFYQRSGPISCRMVQGHAARLEAQHTAMCSKLLPKGIGLDTANQHLTLHVDPRLRNIIDTYFMSPRKW